MPQSSRIPLVLALIGVATTSVASESYDLSAHDSTLRAVSAYARASGLPALAATDGPELRIWFDSVMTGTIYGYVLSNSKALECAASYSLRGETIIVRKGHCHQSRTLRRHRPVLERLKELATLDGRELNCGVEDGAEVYVDGTFDHRRITMVAGNPDLCSDAESKLVADIVKKLTSD
jgi:hypothetical protein